MIRCCIQTCPSKNSAPHYTGYKGLTSAGKRETVPETTFGTVRQRFSVMIFYETICRSLLTSQKQSIKLQLNSKEENFKVFKAAIAL